MFFWRTVRDHKIAHAAESDLAKGLECCQPRKLSMVSDGLALFPET
jgi:hypothetical protein